MIYIPIYLAILQWHLGNYAIEVTLNDMDEIDQYQSRQIRTRTACIIYGIYCKSVGWCLTDVYPSQVWYGKLFRGT